MVDRFTDNLLYIGLLWQKSVGFEGTWGEYQMVAMSSFNRDTPDMTVFIPTHIYELV